MDLSVSIRKTPFVIEELDLQDPKAGEVLVKLAACGVCHSDYHLVTGDTRHPMPNANRFASLV